MRYIENTLPAPLTADIAVDDSAYEELALHAADILLPALHVVGHVLADVAVALLSSYVYDRLKDAAARRETRVRATLYVEEEDRSVRLTYDGPAEAFGATIQTALGQALPPATPNPNRRSTSKAGDTLTRDQLPLRVPPANRQRDDGEDG